MLLPQRFLPHLFVPWVSGKVCSETETCLLWSSNVESSHVSLLALCPCLSWTAFVESCLPQLPAPSS